MVKILIVELTDQATESIGSNNFFIIGNNLSLDFINTEYVLNGERKDALSGYTDLLAWAVAVGVLDAKQRKWLAREFGASNAAAEAFTRALDFRATLRVMVEGLEKGKKVKPQTLAAINEMLRAGKSGYAELAPTDEGFTKIFRADFNEPSEILLPIAEAAADLLCYGEMAYLKKCQNPECILHFYDTSKNHRRRWCSMAICGNRAKAAAFYNRKKKNQ